MGCCHVRVIDICLEIYVYKSKSMVLSRLCYVMCDKVSIKESKEGAFI